MTLHDTLEGCAQQFDQHPGLSLTDRVLGQVMKACGASDERADVLHKVALVNALYGTNVYDVLRLAEHISSVRVAQNLSAGEADAVKNIATGHRIGGSADGTGERVFYVFATKYAHWHNHDAYPIFDFYVGWLLPRLADRFPDAAGLEQSLRSGGSVTAAALDYGDPQARYTNLKGIIDALRAYLGRSRWSYKRIDQGLWVYGKWLYSKQFPKKNVLAGWPPELRDDLEQICTPSGGVNPHAS